MLVIFLLIIIFLNINIKEKFNNKYLKNYENFKNLIIEYFNDENNKKPKEKFSNNIDKTNIDKTNIDKSYDFTPFVNEDKNKDINIDSLKEKNENKIEPFKTEVLKLKDLYENIKLEITKLK